MLTQEQRHNMIESFKASHGEETAMTLAEGLFSNDLATKDDLDGLRGEFKELRAEMKSNFRWTMAGLFAMFGSMVTLFGLAMGVG